MNVRTKKIETISIMMMDVHEKENKKNNNSIVWHAEGLAQGTLVTCDRGGAVVAESRRRGG